MGNKTRVVVTGLGAITPIGNDVASFWQGLKDKKVGIAPITYFDTTDYKAKLAGEVKDFDPKKYMDPKAARRMEPFSQYAVAAAGEAIARVWIWKKRIRSAWEPASVPVSEAYRRWNVSTKKCWKKDRTV